MPATYGVHVLGVTETVKALRKVEDQTLPAEYRAGLEEAAALSERAIGSGAPRGRTGQLAAKLTHKLSPATVPTYAVVKTTATRSSAKYRRFSYPRLLEFVSKYGHAGWMINRFKSVHGQVQAIIQRTASRIQARWGR